MAFTRKFMACLEHPSDCVSAPGLNVKFAVNANGSGLTYKWEYLPTDGDGSWRPLYQFDTAEIEITTYEFMSGYQYHCIITDELGMTVTSNPATITMIDFRVTSWTSETNVSVGHNAYLDFDVIGENLKLLINPTSGNE